MSIETEERVIAIIRLIAMLGSSAATAVGFAIDADSLAMVLLCLASAVCMAWAWWKNSNMTEAAQMAQQFLNEIKAEEKGEE